MVFIIIEAVSQLFIILISVLLLPGRMNSKFVDSRQWQHLPQSKELNPDKLLLVSRNSDKIIINQKKNHKLIFNLAAILPNNVFLKRDYRRALQNTIREHNSQVTTKDIIKYDIGIEISKAQTTTTLNIKNTSIPDSSSVLPSLGSLKTYKSDNYMTKKIFGPGLSSLSSVVARRHLKDTGVGLINQTTNSTVIPEFVNSSSLLSSSIFTEKIYNYRLYNRKLTRAAIDTFLAATTGASLEAANEVCFNKVTKGFRFRRSGKSHKDENTISYEIKAREFYVTSWDLEEVMNLFCETILPTAHPDALIFVSNEPQSHPASVASIIGYFFKTVDKYGIPIIVWNPDNSVTLFQNRPNPNIIQLAPLINHQILAILALMERYSWERFAIITNTPIIDDQDIVYGFRNYIYYSDPRYKRFKIIKIIRLESFVHADLLTSLQPLTQSTGRIFVLNCNRDEALNVFKVSNELHLTGKDYMWIVTQGVIGNKQEFIDFDKNQDYPIGIFGIYYDTSPESSVEQIELASAVYANAVHSFVLGESLETSQKFLKEKLQFRNCNDHITTPENFETVRYASLFYDYLNGVKFQHGTKCNVSFEQDGSANHIRFDIINLNAERTWNKIGEWNMGGGGLEIKDITWPGNSHLPPKDVPEQFHLKVSSLEEPPFLIVMDTTPVPSATVLISSTAISSYNNNNSRITPTSTTNSVTGFDETGKDDQTAPKSLFQCNGGVPCKSILDKKSNLTGGSISTLDSSHHTCCSGYFIDILEKLSQDLAFTYELTYTTEEQAITTEKSKSDVLVEHLNKGQSEMAIGLTITSRHSEMVDFSVPFLETGIAIAVSLRTGSISPIAFLEPFDYVTWVLILIICIHAAALSIFMYEYISPMGFDMKKRDPSTSDERSNFSVFRAIWLAWAILFGASVQVDVPKSHTSRFLITIWSMVAMVFIASYTANLAAFMISKDDHYDFIGIHDTRLRNPYQKEPPYRYATVAYSSSALNIKKNYLDMYTYMTHHNKSDVKDGIAAVKNGSLDAFIYDGRVLEYLVGRDDQCKILTVGSWFAMTGYSIAFPKSSEELKTSVDAMLMKYQENGDMDRLQHFWLAGDCKLKKNQNDASHPLGLRNFISAFTLLGAGLVLSLIFLGLEHFYFRFLRKHLKKIDKHGLCSLISLNMGRTLSFEKTVLEVKDKFLGQKCSNIVCKTQIWKVKQELLLAGIKTKQLERMVDDLRNDRWRGLSYIDLTLPRNGYNKNPEFSGKISNKSRSNTETFF